LAYIKTNPENWSEGQLRNALKGQKHRWMNFLAKQKSRGTRGMKLIDAKTYAKDGNATKNRIIFL